MDNNYVVYDIETRTWAEEHPHGWEDIPLFGLALAVTWDPGAGFKTWLEAYGLADYLLGFPKIVSFNGLRFDNAIVAHDVAQEINDWWGREKDLVDALAAGSFDLLAELQKRLGHRVGLGQLAQALGEDKLATGADAPLWWKAREQLLTLAGFLEKRGDQVGSSAVQALALQFLGRIEEYCRHDVELTRQIYEKAREKGQVSWVYKGQTHSVKVEW